MKFRCTEAIWPSPDRLDSYPWITAVITPDRIAALIPCDGNACPEDEESRTILFESGFRWQVRAKIEDWERLERAMSPAALEEIE